MTLFPSFYQLSSCALLLFVFLYPFLSLTNYSSLPFLFFSSLFIPGFLHPMPLSLILSPLLTCTSPHTPLLLLSHHFPPLFLFWYPLRLPLPHNTSHAHSPSSLPLLASSHSPPSSPHAPALLSLLTHLNLLCLLRTHPPGRRFQGFTLRRLFGNGFNTAFCFVALGEGGPRHWIILMELQESQYCADRISEKNDTLLVQLQKKSILYWWNCRKMLIL